MNALRGLLDSLGPVSSVLRGLLGLLLCWLAGRFARRLARRGLERRGANPETLILVPRAIYFSLLALGVAIFVSAAFSQPMFALNSVLIATLIAGLGFQDLVKNYVSGFYILFEGNIRVGDTIKTEAFTGEVTDVRIRVTYLRGEDGSLIVVPNSELFNKTVQVQQPSPRRQVPQPSPRRARSRAPKRAPPG